MGVGVSSVLGEEERNSGTLGGSKEETGDRIGEAKARQAEALGQVHVVNWSAVSVGCDWLGTCRAEMTTSRRWIGG